MSRRVARITLLLGVALAASAARAENLVANPSAELAHEDGTPVGWGLYRGAGEARLAVTTAARRSGRSAARLTLTRWHVPAGVADTPESRIASAAVVLAPNGGYRAWGALRGEPGAAYLVSFWYQGDLPAATVGVTGWPALDADHARRSQQLVSGGTLRPGPGWQRFAGVFRLPAGTYRFVVTIQVGGRQRDGARLGTLSVDDVELARRTFPGGQLRGIWAALPEAQDAAAGRREIALALDRVKGAGLDTVFLWVESRYAAALERPDLRAAEPRASWDAVGEWLRGARARGLEVHLWYSPWLYKQVWRAPELRDHPDWAAVNAAGVADSDALCFARPEVRRHALAVIARLVDRYPGLAGVHVEEPGYNWGQYCACAHCRRVAREQWGVDLARDPAAARPQLDHLAAAASTDFMARLRQQLLARRPDLWLSANGSAGADADRDWRIGRDWITWARRGYIDFYVPQVYTTSGPAFVDGVRRTCELVAPCDLVPGLAVSWSGIHPARQSPATVAEQLRGALRAGASGFVVFRLEHATPAHLDAVRDALRGR